MSVDIDTEQDIERLREVAKLQERELERLTSRLGEVLEQLAEAEGQTKADLQAELDALQSQLDEHKSKRFGDSSERRGRPDSADDGSDDTNEDSQDQTGHGPTDQPQLEVVEEIHELDDADQTCPNCGGDLTPIDGLFEETEEVDVVERRYVLKKHKKRKYRCECHDHIETALGPTKIIDGGRYSIEFAVDSAVQKYADHIPLARQTKVAARQGLEIQSQTIWDQIHTLAVTLEGAYKATCHQIQNTDVIGADETSWRWLEDGNARDIWLWAARSRRGVMFRFDESRDSQAADRLLSDFSGTVVCDGYSAYTKLNTDRDQQRLGEARAGPIELAGCMAHMRRKFIRAEDYDSQAGELLDDIAELYAIESKLDRNDGERFEEFARRRTAVRQNEARPVLDRLKSRIESTNTLPKSPLGKAVTYADNQWNLLVKYADDGRLPIDNNDVERALRQPVVGRKNYYGCRSRAGLDVAETLYTLIGTCQILGVDPHEYLSKAAHRAVRFSAVEPLTPHDMLDQVR